MRENFPGFGYSPSVRRLCVVSTFGVLLALGLSARDAAAQRTAPGAGGSSGDSKQACVASSEKAQRFRLDGKLGEAQHELLICSRESCPSVVRADCNMWLNEVAALMPSIVVGAKDESGGDIVDVRVFVDGHQVQSRLDGKSMAVPTGEHTVRLERDGAQPMEQKVLIREGEKARAISFQWKGSSGGTGNGSGSGSGSGSGAGSGSGSGDTGPVTPTTREHTIYPWILVGVGGVTAVSGGIMYFVNRGDVPAQCNFDSRSCATGSSGGVQQAAEVATSRANTGLVIGVVGLVVMAGGLVWHFVEPTGPIASASMTSPATSPPTSPRTSMPKPPSVARLTFDTLTSVSPVSSPTFTGATLSGSF